MSDTYFNSDLIDEIYELNQTFIGLMLEHDDRGRFCIEPSLREALVENRLRLPKCPFLLFRPIVQRFGEADNVSIPIGELGVAALVVATLTSVRELAKRDLPAAMLVTGANESWCRDLTRRTPADVLDLARECALRPRLIDVPGYWQDLVRQAGISALQRASLGASGLQLIHSRRDRLQSLNARTSTRVRRVADRDRRLPPVE